MRFDLLTLFPDMCASYLNESIIGRAQEKGILDINIYDIREFTKDKHKRVDDYAYGGGMGMVMQVEPIYNCIKSLENEINAKPYVIYMSPKGRIFNQKVAKELLKFPEIAVLCGHYEGIDQRVIDLCVDDEISIGDFVLTGGELPALALIDCVSRMIPGVLSGEECYEDESIYSGLLEYPHYTRPASFMGIDVPEVLLSGHDKNIKHFRRAEALRITAERRPDLLYKAELTPDDIKILKEIWLKKEGD